MANDLAKQYTDEQYLSKRELQDALKTSLVDGYWRDILAYRKEYQRPLGLKSITNRAFYYVATPMISKKASLCFENLIRLVNLMKKAEPGSEKQAMERALLYENLSGINRAYESKTSDLALKAIINGTYRDNGEGEDKHLRDYLRTLRMCLDSVIMKPDDNFLAKIYGSLLQEDDDLTKWYRQGDFDNRISKNAFYTDADYPYAPASSIEGLMDDFYHFLSSDEEPLIKALTSLFFLIYVKPFDSKNEEIATLFALDILAFEGGLGKEAFYLPLSKSLIIEPVLSDNYFIGAQRAGDLTYYFMRSFHELSELALSLKGTLDDIHLAKYEEEAHSLSQEEEDIVKRQQSDSVSKEAKQMSLFEEPEENDKEETTLSDLLHIKESDKPNDAPIAKEKEEHPPLIKKASKKDTLPSISKEEMLRANGEEIALKKKDSLLSDKEIKEYVRYLLESNYSLNRSQASFLANHCTIGHYYSIQQYKRFARCAYETARTSMEKLVNEGYYKKLQVKNKFVYTPVKQDKND